MSDDLTLLRSPNFNNRGKSVPRVVVLHASAGKSDKGDVTWLADKKSGVSYHTLIGRDGTVYAMVKPEYRAWHCGASEWNGIKDVNAVALGVSFCNKHDHTEPLTAAQIAAGRTVVEAWCKRYPIEDVTTHAAIAPGRKFDPLHVPNFYLADWQEILDTARGM